MIKEERISFPKLQTEPKLRFIDKRRSEVQEDAGHITKLI